MKLGVGRIAEILKASGEFHAASVADGYSIDTRTLQPGDLYFAIKGERLDGHDFVEEALSKGAAAAVVSQQQAPRFAGRRNLLIVDDTLRALQTLAHAVRRQWGRTLIGVTGSVGKTTTKDAIAQVLAQRYKVHKSVGNFNNHIGLPLMLLRLEPEHGLAASEMGMSHAGEIAELARIAEPEVGVVTAVAPVHLEYFDSLAGIALAKQELISGLPRDGTAVLNADDEYVSKFGKGYRGKVVYFGGGPSADVRAESIQDRGLAGTVFNLVAGGQIQAVTLPLVGRHNVWNALAAAAVGLSEGLPLAEVAAALGTLTPADKRGQVLKLGNITVINDCYNSNPKALNAMVDTLAAMPALRRIVVAGEMLELGLAGERLHRACGQYIASRGIDFLLGVCGLAEYMVQAARRAGMRAEFVETSEAAGEWLARETRDGDAVLLKASRGVKLEKALETWQSAVRTTND
jgi:UDP-N-acetylmuramoyl-tripeptide--D-alanyl-D-alanine ligase